MPSELLFLNKEDRIWKKKLEKRVCEKEEETTFGLASFFNHKILRFCKSISHRNNK